MEDVSSEVGAKLIELLWSMDPTDVVLKEIEAGIETLFVGIDVRLRRWLGRTLNRSCVYDFIEEAKSAGAEPLGEHGEYHTLLLNSPKHISQLKYEVIRAEGYGGYWIARVI